MISNTANSQQANKKFFKNDKKQFIGKQTQDCKTPWNPDVRSDSSSVDSSSTSSSASSSASKKKAFISNRKSTGGFSGRNKTGNSFFSSASTSQEVQVPNRLIDLVEQSSKDSSKIYQVKGVISEIFAEEFAYYLSDDTATVRLVCSDKNPSNRLKLAQVVQLKVKRNYSTFYQADNTSLTVLDENPFEYLIESIGTLIYLQNDKKFLIQKTDPAAFGSIDFSLKKLTRAKKAMNHDNFDYRVLRDMLACLSLDKIQVLEEKINAFRNNLILSEVFDCFEYAKVLIDLGKGKCIDKSFKLIRVKSTNSSKEKSSTSVDKDSTVELGSIRLGRLNNIISNIDQGQEPFKEADADLPLFTQTKILVVIKELSAEDQESLKNEYSDRYGTAIFVKSDELENYFGKKNAELITKHLGDKL